MTAAPSWADLRGLTPDEARAVHDAVAHGEQLVYFIQSAEGGPVKIGVAAQPDERLCDLQVASAHRLTIRKVLAGGIRLERDLHQRFASARLSGEWFAPIDELCALCGARRSDDPATSQARLDGFQLGYAAARAEASRVRPTMTAREVADWLGFSSETVLRWTRQGEIPAIQMPGGAIRYPRDLLDEWIAERRRGPRGAAS